MATCHRGDHTIDEASRCDPGLPTLSINRRRSIKIDYRIEMEEFVAQQHVSKVEFASVGPSPSSHFHNHRFGCCNWPFDLNEREQSEIDLAVRCAVVFDPARAIDEDRAQRGPVSVGNSSIAFAPRISRTCSRVIGMPANRRVAMFTASTFVSTPYLRMMISKGSSSSSIFVRVLLIHQLYTSAVPCARRST